MVVVTVKDREYYLDGYLKSNLDYVKARLRRKNEMFIGIVDGRVGTGKSTFVDQIAHYCTDGNFTLDDKAFTVKDFSERLAKKKKGDLANCVVLDEAYELNKKKTASYANFKILKQLQRIRSKNLWIWIVLPSIYDLDKNIILNLANLFLRTYTKQDFGRKGQFLAFNRQQVKKLWLYSRQSLTYGTRPCFYGRFTAKFPSGNYQLYENKKNKILDDSDDETENRSKKVWLDTRNVIIWEEYNNGASAADIASRFKMHPYSVNRIIRNRKELQQQT